MYFFIKDWSVEDFLPCWCAGSPRGGEGCQDHGPGRQVPGLLPGPTRQKVRYLQQLPGVAELGPFHIMKVSLASVPV
jgi:hypothetical protein